MRVPLTELARVSQVAETASAKRVPLLAWLLPALGAGAGSAATGVSAFWSLAASAAAAAALYLGARAVMFRLSPPVAAAAPQTMQTAQTFDAIVGAVADVPASARETIESLDGVLAELMHGTILPSDARDMHAAVTRHLPEALATFRALPPSARAVGEPLLVSQLASIHDRLMQLLQSVQRDRLAASRRLDLFLRDKSSR